MYDQSESDLLRKLADRTGIVADYYDIAGTQHVTTDETRRAILTAMNLRVANREELIAELEAWDNRWWLRGCEPVHVLRLGRDAGTWSWYGPCEKSGDSGLHIRWSLYAENGETQCKRADGPGLRVEESRTIQGHRFVRIALAFPQGLPLGYYSVKAHAKGGGTNTESTFRLIVAPERCYIPDNFSGVFDGGAWPCSSIHYGAITIGESVIFEIWPPSSNGRESVWALRWSGWNPSTLSRMPSPIISVPIHPAAACF